MKWRHVERKCKVVRVVCFNDTKEHFNLMWCYSVWSKNVKALCIWSLGHISKVTSINWLYERYVSCHCFGLAMKPYFTGLFLLRGSWMSYVCRVASLCRTSKKFESLSLKLNLLTLYSIQIEYPYPDEIFNSEHVCFKMSCLKNYNRLPNILHKRWSRRLFVFIANQTTAHTFAYIKKHFRARDMHWHQTQNGQKPLKKLPHQI